MGELQIPLPRMGEGKFLAKFFRHPMPEALNSFVTKSHAIIL